MNLLSQTSAQTSTEKTAYSRQFLDWLTEQPVSLAFSIDYLIDAERKEIILSNFFKPGEFLPDEISRLFTFALMETF